VLVLTRKVGDVIAIGDNIKIVVMAIKGKQVRLGVQADRNTIVHREEIYQKIQQETRAALQNDMSTARIAGEMFKVSTDANESDVGLVRAKRTAGGFVVRRASTTVPVEPKDDDMDDHDMDGEGMDGEGMDGEVDFDAADDAKPVPPPAPKPARSRR